MPTTLYVPNLAVVRGEIGGSTYVIAELDRSFTKYYEAGLETEWRGRGAYFRGSYGGATTTAISTRTTPPRRWPTTPPSSSARRTSPTAPAASSGSQHGDLRGDRRHQLKLFGYYTLPWHASVGAYAIYQSGQPWERQDVEVYRSLTTSLSDTNRYAEPAGSRQTDDHYQLDLNYTHDFPLGSRFNIQARVDVFNVFDKQTGYNVQSLANSANFGREQTFYDPRRFQVAIRLEF